MWKKLLQSLKLRSEEIGSVTAVIGLVVSTAGFYFTISQVVETRRALQASNVYEIQRDARTLISEVTTDELVKRAIRGDVLDGNEKEVLQTVLWRINNFYISVYRQSAAGGISDEFSKSFQRDFCDFVSYPSLAITWSEMESVGLLGLAHKEMREEWCK